MRNPLADKVVEIKPSGIRKFFDVAKEIGCTPQNVQAFEKGKTKSGKILEYYVKAGYKYE